MEIWIYLGQFLYLGAEGWILFDGMNDGSACEQRFSECTESRSDFHDVFAFLYLRKLERLPNNVAIYKKVLTELFLWSMTQLVEKGACL